MENKLKAIEVVFLNLNNEKRELFELLSTKGALCLLGGETLELTQSEMEQGYFLKKYDRLSINFGGVASSHLSVLLISGLSMDYQKVFEFISLFQEINSFTQARYYDVEFDYWENASDLNIYKANNRDYSNLEVVSNGLPFPLTQDIIDVTNNAGYRKVYEEHITFVGEVLVIKDTLIENKDLNSLKSSFAITKSNRRTFISLKRSECVGSDEYRNSMQLQRDVIFN